MHQDASLSACHGEVTEYVTGCGTKGRISRNSRTAPGRCELSTSCGAKISRAGRCSPLSPSLLELLGCKQCRAFGIVPVVLIRDQRSPKVALARQSSSFLGISLLQHLHTALAVMVVTRFLQGAVFKPARIPGFDKAKRAIEVTFSRTIPRTGLERGFLNLPPWKPTGLGSSHLRASELNVFAELYRCCLCPNDPILFLQASWPAGVSSSIAEKQPRRVTISCQSKRECILSAESMAG